MKAKVNYKFRELKGSIVYSKVNKDKVVFMEDVLNGKFTIRSIDEGITTEIGIDPYKKTK